MASRRRKFMWVLAVIGTVSVVGAALYAYRQRGGEASEAAAAGAPTGAGSGSEAAVRTWSPPNTTDLSGLDPEGARDLKWSSASRYPPCREFFEPAGDVVEPFPSLEPSVAEVRAGCNPEAWLETDRRRYLAYRLPVEGSERRDLRFVAYAAGGGMIWSHRVERGRHGDDFLANFLGSFIVPLPPHLACVGTRWQGGTQVTCLDHDSGEVAYSGRMPFWSGIDLQGQATSLVGADISGLTRRYPYSGVEMERRDFESTGGRSALYVTDGRRLYFGADEPPWRLTAYRFESLQPQWHLELPAAPETGLEGAGLEGLPVVLLHVESTIHAVEVDSGGIAWSLALGAAGVEVAHDGERVYLMRHRAEKQNQLIAIDPKTGDLAWWGHVPLGTLDVEVVGGEVFTESVRAVQRLVDRGAGGEGRRE